MPKKSTPTFVHEMPLRTDRKQLHALLKRFDVEHFAYKPCFKNCCKGSMPCATTCASRLGARCRKGGAAMKRPKSKRTGTQPGARRSPPCARNSVFPNTLRMRLLANTFVLRTILKI